MKRPFRADPPRPFFNRLLYLATWYSCNCFLKIVYRFRVHGKDRVPETGGMVICSNHQSNLDPVVVGCMLPRPTNFLAKTQLFKGLMGWYLPRVDGIPLDREGTGVSGMREALRRMKKDESVVMFPEGTRSRSDKMLPLRPGVGAFIRRVKKPVLPIGIAGSREGWPPGKNPRFGKVRAVFGEPIRPDEFAELDEAATVELVTQRIQACVDEARRLRDG